MAIIFLRHEETETKIKPVYVFNVSQRSFVRLYERSGTSGHTLPKRPPFSGGRRECRRT